MSRHGSRRVARQVDGPVLGRATPDAGPTWGRGRRGSRGKRGKPVSQAEDLRIGHNPARDAEVGPTPGPVGARGDLAARLAEPGRASTSSPSTAANTSPKSQHSSPRPHPVQTAAADAPLDDALRDTPDRHLAVTKRRHIAVRFTSYAIPADTPVDPFPVQWDVKQQFRASGGREAAQNGPRVAVRGPHRWPENCAGRRLCACRPEVQNHEQSRQSWIAAWSRSRHLRRDQAPGRNSLIYAGRPGLCRRGDLTRSGLAHVGSPSASSRWVGA